MWLKRRGFTPFTVVVMGGESKNDKIVGGGFSNLAVDRLRLFDIPRHETNHGQGRHTMDFSGPMGQGGAMLVGILPSWFIPRVKTARFSFASRSRTLSS